MSYSLYNADLGGSKGILINNTGGAYDNEKLRDFQGDFHGDTRVYVDATSQGYKTTKGEVQGDKIEVKFDSKSCEVDIVEFDAQDFVGDFDMNIKSVNSEDKIYIGQVLSFSAVDSKGDPVGDVYTGSNVYGGGETGDQNAAEFGDGTYSLQDTSKGPAAYEIEYIDRYGNLQTITIDVHIDNGSTTTLALDFICFARGSMIAVAGGMKRVEDLTPGDMVMTKDNGLQPLRWIASRTLGASELRANPDIRPIRIKAGALGENLPATDLVVSPQHRLLLDDWRCEALFGTDEMLAPAKALVNDSTVTVDHDCDEVEYFHFMFDQHEIVYANGVESESFHPGDFGLSTLHDAALDELFKVFPHLEHDVNAFGAPARPVLRAFETRAMMSA